MPVYDIAALFEEWFERVKELMRRSVSYIIIDLQLWSLEIDFENMRASVR